MSSTNIEWTRGDDGSKGETWNPVSGCEAVSPGCANCYAATMTRRLEAMGQAAYSGLTTAKHFNGVVRTLPHKLTVPLKWKKPRRVFVNSMSDLFHEDVPDEFIDKVFGVMLLADQHTFQILTKRAERMAEYMSDAVMRRGSWMLEAFEIAKQHLGVTGGMCPKWKPHWEKSRTVPPLKNVWLGVSVERQQEADERIPWLLKTPAAVRFLSCEPLLGPLDLQNERRAWLQQLKRSAPSAPVIEPGIDWVIVGGESGGGARPCGVHWIRSIVEQCRAARVPCFVKQVGGNPQCPSEDVRRGDWMGNGTAKKLHAINGKTLLTLSSSKGGDWDEWPVDLRVREFPQEAAHA